jgi:hypothetical protein
MKDIFIIKKATQLLLESITEAVPALDKSKKNVLLPTAGVGTSDGFLYFC